jgi:hypothetical protein
LTYARLFIVVIFTAMRMVDVERAKCVGVDPDGSARLHSFATKGVTWAKMTSMDIICPPTGVLPEASGAPASARWFATFMESCVGREWLFPSFDSPPGSAGSVVGATWREPPQAASLSQITGAFYNLLSLGGFSKELMRQADFTPHAVRHLAPDLARVFLPMFSDQERREIGRWAELPEERVARLAKGSASPSSRLRMSNHYSRGEAALQSERQVRIKLFDQVRRCVRELVPGSFPWSTVIPWQRGEIPSFNFLVLKDDSQSCIGSAQESKKQPQLG